MISTKTLIEVAKFVEEKRNGGTEKYFSFKDIIQYITQFQLDFICEMFNKYVMHEDECLCNSTGEIFYSKKRRL